jgi:K+-transporting ATPase KdpF subunit
LRIALKPPDFMKTILIAIIAILLIGYLLVAMLYPEKF